MFLTPHDTNKQYSLSTLFKCLKDILLLLNNLTNCVCETFIECDVLGQKNTKTKTILISLFALQPCKKSSVNGRHDILFHLFFHLILFD